MRHRKSVILKSGEACVIRTAGADDGKECLDFFIKTHGQTDFLLFYPEEVPFTEEDEIKYLKEKEENPRECELLAVLNGKIVGMAGIEAVGSCYKLSHRAELGISVDKDFWRLGIGRALTKECIEISKNAGYEWLELNVFSENKAAISLYRDFGFKECGRIPKGFRLKDGKRQDMLLMTLKLTK